VRVLDNFPLATLREFMTGRRSSTLGIEGRLSRILDDERQGAQARQIFVEANALLDKIVENNLITARGVYGFFPPLVWATTSSYIQTARAIRCWSVFTSFANRRTKKQRTCRSLADFIAPKETAAGSHRRIRRDQRIGLKKLCDQFRAEHDDTTRSWLKQSQIVWLKRLQNACINACAMSGVTAVQKA